MDLTGLAAAQHCVVHVDQLAAAGVGRSTLRRRVADGLWQRVLPGVVALHPGRLTAEARRHAVALWLPGGVLCGPTAAAVHGVDARPTTLVHVAVLSGRPRGAAWVRVHRLRDLPPAHRTTVGGLPLTSAARTVVDVHDTTSGYAARRALVLDAVQRRVVRPHAVIAAAVTTPGLRRRSELGGTLLYALAGAQSVAEVAFAEFCAVWGLPEPVAQHAVPTRLGPLHLDFAVPRERVGVEVDGFDGHAYDRQRRRDHERDMALAAVGWLVVRIEPRRLVAAPELVHDDLVRLLTRRRAAAPA
jgi:hypothetical protein